MRTTRLGLIGMIGAFLILEGLTVVLPLVSEVEAQSNKKIVNWTPTGSMAHVRRDHTATRLADGRVLILGGAEASTAPEIYDPLTGIFSSAGNTIFAHGSLPTATLLRDGRVLIVGGTGDSTSAEIFDPVTKTFSPTGSMHSPHINHTATLLPDNRVLITAGQTPLIESHAIAELFDPVAGTFSLTVNLNERRSGHTATLLENGQVLITGGIRTTSPAIGIALDSAELYDPTTGIFTTTNSMIRSRTGHTATLIPGQNGMVLVAGGVPWRSTAEIYNPVTGLFSPISNMISPHSSHTATLLVSGEILIAGGVAATGPNTSNQAELYDPVSGTFTTPSTMLSTRQQHAATLLSDGRVLLVGGSDGDASINTAELGELVGPTQPTTGDSFLHAFRKNSNEGANHYLIVQKWGRKRTVVGFGLSGVTEDVTKATLTLTLAKPTKWWGRSGRMVDVHRLTEPFTEGNGFVWGQKWGMWDRGDGSGVTWNCSADTDISNRRSDCDDRWKGGSKAIESVTDSILLTNGQTGEVSWDVTVDVQAALANDDTEIQWLIKKAKERRWGKAVFYSKEGAAEVQDMDKAPRLVLEFSE